MKDKQKFCAVVKADAYGFGARKVCCEINDLVDYFAVSSEGEFFDIKDVVTKQILVLDPIYENITKLAVFGCEFCVSNKQQLNLILNEAKENNDVLFKLHLAFNTGMNRFGFNTFEDVFECINLIKKTQNISIIGVFSHFYSGNNKKSAHLQASKLKDLQQQLSKKIDLNEIIFHICNTSGFITENEFDMIRIGLGLFLNNNRSVFSLKSNIIEIRKIKKGECVGYSGVFIASHDMKIAVISIGYADGVLRCIAGKGYVLIRSNFCKILAVCMDSIIVDISNVNARLKDMVTLIGKNGSKEIFVCDFASWCGTIEYEIMIRISKRVKRIYIGGKYANYNWKVQSEKTSSC